MFIFKRINIYDQYEKNKSNWCHNVTINCLRKNGKINKTHTSCYIAFPYSDYSFVLEKMQIYSKYSGQITNYNNTIKIVGKEYILNTNKIEINI